ncbi:MAG: extracellular solute-binding protein, partial [Anaerolineae bacterium]|nr:extracellular solute-binding protein [Anaerolineae bacterium]
MKRIVYLVMVIAMLASLGAAALAGCAPKPTPAPATEAPQATETPAQPSQPTATPAQPTAAPAKTVEIEFWYGLGGKLGEVVQDFIKRFNESQTEVHVTGVVMPDYQTTLEKLQAAIAAKKPPAIALISGQRIHDLMNAQVLNPLDELVAAELDFNADDIVPAFYQFATWEDGKLYALPLYGTTQVLYYRKDFFEELGISPDMLNTWEDLAEAARKCTKVEGGEVVRWGWEPMWGYPNLMDAVFSRGGKLFSDDGKKVLINDEIWVDTWEQFRKWIHE